MKCLSATCHCTTWITRDLVPVTSGLCHKHCIQFSTSVNHKQPCRGAWQLVRTVMKHWKLLWGPGGNVFIKMWQPYACSCMLFTTCWDSGELRWLDRCWGVETGHIKSVWFRISAPLTIFCFECCFRSLERLGKVKKIKNVAWSNRSSINRIYFSPPGVWK